MASQYQSNRPLPSSKVGYRGEQPNEETSFCNLSNFSKDNTSERTMKESKRLFTKCISEMNSEKRRLSECSAKSPGAEGSNTTSFKALKIQMI
jgi:hypothetical protein